MSNYLLFFEHYNEDSEGDQKDNMAEDKTKKTIDEQLVAAIDVMRKNALARKGKKPVHIRHHGILRVASPGSKKAGYKHEGGRLVKQ